MVYTNSPDKQVQEYDEVEVIDGEYAGFTGTVATICKDGWIKIWPSNDAINQFPHHPQIISNKCWFNRPKLKLLKRFN